GAYSSSPSDSIPARWIARWGCALTIGCAAVYKWYSEIATAMTDTIRRGALLLEVRYWSSRSNFSASLTSTASPPSEPSAIVRPYALIIQVRNFGAERTQTSTGL